ncbi:sugar ABC transporter ATP-binding protein [Borreliella chilensis]|uniref:Sugar ABC transporter ATP-binding protein n=1 Tax=Borreliella chilensis TaxID=1245910 RepID=A0A0A7UVQ2_9SPIR|nr:sugar ABC transporter ATP-binding protein [Borreliella chilensis]
MVEFKNIVKYFPDIDKPILDSINLKIGEVKIFTVVGKNGEGKSTLAKIIAGLIEFDSGEILVNGVKQKNWNVDKAKNNGIYLVSQVPNLKMNLRVWEYLSIYWFGYAFFMPMNKSKTYKYYKWLMQFYNISFDLDKKIKDLNIKEIYFLLIIASLKENAKIIIFDESAAYFSQKEAQSFIKLLVLLKKSGIASFFITHSEIADAVKFSDEFIVLKDGKCFRTINKETILSKLESSSDRVFFTNINFNKFEKDSIRFNLFFEDFWKYDVSFSLSKRGVLGIIGEEAAIKTWEKLFLGELFFVGSIKIDGIRYERVNIFECKAGFLPLGIGNLFPDNSSILDNFLAKFMNFENKIFIRQSYVNKIKDFFKKKMEFYSKEEIYRILYSKSLAFSGGTLKKFALYREMYIAKSFLICFSPLSNLDHKSCNEMSVAIRNYSKEKPVLLFTSNLDELLLLSDNILAMKMGEVLLNVSREELSKEKLKELLFL